MLRPLGKSKLSDKSPVIAGVNKKRIVSIVLCLFMFAILTIGLTNAAIDRIQASIRSEHEASLNAIKNVTEAALNYWSEQRKSELLRLAENEVVQSIAQNLYESYENKDLEGFTEYQNVADLYLNSLKTVQSHAEYHLLTIEGFYLYSNQENVKANQSQISKEYPQLLKEALNGKVSFIPPMLVSNQQGKTSALAFFVAPIYYESKVIALIVSSHDAENEMSEIMSLGRLGKSGESYIINKEGMIVSRSRFKDSRIKMKRLKENESEVLRLSLVVPEPWSEYPNQLTAMAQSITQFESSQNLNGYLDYRGVKVIGTWRWIPEMQLGIATEFDFAEANIPFNKSKNTIISLVAVNIGIALSMSVILLVLSNNTNRKLRKAAHALEDTVISRTCDLEQTAILLESEKATLQSILDSIPDPIFCKDSEGRYVLVNQSFANLTGLSQEEIVGKSDSKLFPKEDADFFIKDDDKLLASGIAHIIERPTVDMKGNKLLFETRKTLIHYRGQDKAGILGICRDITDRKRFEEAMMNATRSAQEASNAKSEFLARMSHEIRTPMNGVLGMIDLLLDSTLDSDQTHKLKIAKNSASTLLTIINDILDFSRVEAGKLELESIDFNLSHQVETIVQTLAVRSDEKGVELIVDVTAVEQSMVKGDPIRIRQVLTNLINNAIKFTEFGQIVVRARAVKKGDITEVECSVEDSGIGIASESLEHLFDSFSQVDNSTTRNYGGSGLGLAISKRLVELMGGEIYVFSTLHEGSTFSFRLDLETSSLKEKPLPHSNINNWQVLVVDDNQTNRDILTNQLTNWGLRVILASSADEALKKLNAEPLKLDLIITDMNMPDKDGLALVSDIKLLEQYKNVKILMLSSMALQMPLNEYRTLGLDACLMKPIGITELFNTLSLLSRNSDFVTENTLVSYSEEQPIELIEWPKYNKVLIVEDNQVNQLVAEGILKKFGLHYGVAMDGSIALEALLNSEIDQPYTLILMDCQMPVLDGYRCSEKIREGHAGERYKDIPIIAMTANAMKGDREKCLLHGMNDHVPKPIDAVSLQKALIAGFKLTPAHLLDFTNFSHNEKSKDLKEKIIFPESLLTIDRNSPPPVLIDQPSIYLKSLALFQKHHGNITLSFPNTRAEMDVLKTKLHTIKGSSGNIGLNKVYLLTIELEDKIKNNKLTSSDLERFNRAISETILDINKIIDINSSKSNDSQSMRPLRVVLSEIKPLVDNSELVPFELVDELSRISKVHIEDLELHDIVNALEEFNYEKTKTLIEGKL